MTKIINNYFKNFTSTLGSISKEQVGALVSAVKNLNKNNNRLFICGNGGSGANAIHLANDLLFSKSSNTSIDVEALTSNSAILTCLANDLGYKHIFSKQLEVKAKKNDMLLIFSGSGNSPIIIEAAQVAKKLKMSIFAIVGFDGGKCKKIIKNCIHININDMQISEDFQMIIGHIIMKSIIK